MRLNVTFLCLVLAMMAIVTFNPNVECKAKKIKRMIEDLIHKIPKKKILIPLPLPIPIPIP